jgi:proton-dependent oligopeptide transporter, POT family
VTSPNTDPRAPLPTQIPFIIGNEACERFSFYGMRNILVKFLTSTMLLGYVPDKELRELEAKDIFHTFVMGVYFFPLLGGWLSDRFFGKFNTILWFSLIYCAGQGCLAFFVDDRHGFYTGLFLIALGSGGIKPLVASFVGDQFDQSNKHRAKVVFDAFYWSINFGSFFASLLMPYFLRSYGPTVAFGIPGALMFVATIIFVLGAPRYVRVPPAPPDPNSFFRVSLTALFSGGAGGKGAIIAMCGLALAASSFLLLFWFDLIKVLCIVLVITLAFFSAGVSSQLERARGKHSDEAVDGVRAVLRILIVFALITPFWSLFDQKASTWVLQGNHMAQPTWFESSQMQLVNPALVMLLIPLNNLVVFPWLRKRGWPLTALGKMTVGMALAGVSFAITGVIQLAMDRASLQIDVTGATAQISTEKVWIYLQIIPYVFLTLGEVLVSATGLEFAYSQAPKSMKGVIMSFFNLTVTVGGLWTLLANESIQRKSVVSAIEDTGIGTNAFFLFFFALFALIAAYGFRVYARRYKVVDNYLHSPPVAPVAQVPKATAREKPEK